MACCGQATNGLMGYGGGGLGRSYLKGGTLTDAEVEAKNIATFGTKDASAYTAVVPSGGIPLWAYAAGGALVVGGIAYVVLSSPKKATPNRRRSRRRSRR